MVSERRELVHGRVLVHARPGRGRRGSRHGRLLLLLLRGRQPLLLGAAQFSDNLNFWLFIGSSRASRVF